MATSLSKWGGRLEFGVRVFPLLVLAGLPCLVRLASGEGSFKSTQDMHVGQRVACVHIPPTTEELLERAKPVCHPVPAYF